MVRVNVSFPTGLSQRAHKLGINVSRTSADAVLAAVVKGEMMEEIRNAKRLE
jgi:post-segregation antitoxin (ccd killing protein)